MQPARDGNKQERREHRRELSQWQVCAPCAYARAGGPPCYFHSSKFGIGKVTTTIAAFANAAMLEAEQTATEIVEEFDGAVTDELKEWP